MRRNILISAPAYAVWDTLTLPLFIRQWTYDTPVEIQTDWKVGSTIIISGDLHGIPFNNSGTILAFDPDTKLIYSFLSSLSNLPDADESYCILEFNLTYKKNQTRLDLTISNFPDEVIRKHLELYWGATLELIRQQTENRQI
ncbi:SRPBCC family protein [Mucilaginibacter lappiensis]|jgi:uncharacterized protein YndB with AHSA1/START domain|uniref:SRPBCC family protein n=1 Tax=Mucilaginibacter lappiensis TaxID=354630 RepID=UPI003D1B5ED7